ncbi:MAG TPA: helix-turn-helix transcriptional regulator [Coriobacteriia bacterium]
MLRFVEEARKRGWSVARLAREASINQVTLYEIKSGDRNARPHVQVRLAVALGTDPLRAAELFEEVSE